MSNKAWSDEEEHELIKMYTGENPEQDIYTIAEYFKKKPRSVISKLVQLKIYTLV